MAGRGYGGDPRLSDGCRTIPPESQWISTAGNGLPDVAQRSRTLSAQPSSLPAMLPDTAVLRGRFLADNRVDAIRLNGRNLDSARARLRRPPSWTFIVVYPSTGSSKGPTSWRSTYSTAGRAIRVPCVESDGVPSPRVGGVCVFVADRSARERKVVESRRWGSGRTAATTDKCRKDAERRVIWQAVRNERCKSRGHKAAERRGCRTVPQPCVSMRGVVLRRMVRGAWRSKRFCVFFKSEAVFSQ